MPGAEAEEPVLVSVAGQPDSVVVPSVGSEVGAVVSSVEVTSPVVSAVVVTSPVVSAVVVESVAGGSSVAVVEVSGSGSSEVVVVSGRPLGPSQLGHRLVKDWNRMLMSS